MKKKRPLFATRLIISLLAMLTASTAWADGSWTSGDCTVTLIGTTLTVSGSGAMADYTDESKREWDGSVSSIESIVINEGVTHIGKRAFSYCNHANLTTITVPATVTTIGDFAFNCVKLETINVDGGNANFSSAEGVLFDKAKTTLISIPRGKTGNYVVPDGVTLIKAYAFQHCTGLSSVVIPASVTMIEDMAFGWCSGLTELTVYAPSCSLGYYTAFYRCNNLNKIYVFNDCLSSYKSASGWSSKETIMEAITIPAREAKTGEYWTTYYNNLSNALAPSGVQVFKVALSGSSLTLTEIDDRIITKGEGVVLKTTSSSVLPEYAASGSATSYSDNDLTGTMTSIANPGNAFVLNYKSETGIGFYMLKSDGIIGANKAYLTYDGALAREFFGFDETTDIEMPTIEDSDAEPVVYDLQGRRVPQPQKGLYIVNGRKVFIK